MCGATHTVQMMFGVCVMLVLLVPSRLIPSVFPDFLPYNLTLTGSANPLREVQLELILLQFIVPTLLEHGNCRAGLKFLIKYWANLASKILYVYMIIKYMYMYMCSTCGTCTCTCVTHVHAFCYHSYTCRKKYLWDVIA